LAEATRTASKERTEFGLHPSAGVCAIDTPMGCVYHKKCAVSMVSTDLVLIISLLLLYKV